MRKLGVARASGSRCVDAGCLWFDYGSVNNLNAARVCSGPDRFHMRGRVELLGRWRNWRTFELRLPH